MTIHSSMTLNMGNKKTQKDPYIFHLKLLSSNKLKNIFYLFFSRPKLIVNGLVKKNQQKRNPKLTAMTWDYISRNFSKKDILNSKFNF